MSRQNTAADQKTPVSPSLAPGSSLPRHYSPTVAGYASGPFLDPQLITPSDWNWRNARTAVVRHSDGLDYRAVRVWSDGDFIGWWAVELLGTPLSAFEE